MTPAIKTKFKNLAQTRELAAFDAIAAESKRRLDTAFYVEGYAARYEPYILFDDPDGEPIFEQFERGCFEHTDMSDILYQYNHSGRVFARTSNRSLLVEPTDDGLFMAADLGRTQAAREHYEDVRSGMITKMSWRFRCGDYFYDAATRTIVHRSVAKIYDVSAVSYPANENTEINARALVDGEIARAARREAELEERRRKLRLKLML